MAEILERQLSAAQAEPALLKELVGFRAEILQFIVRPSEQGRTQITDRVGYIRNYLSNHPPNVRHEFDTIVRHVETLVTYGRRLTLALEQVMALPAQEYLDNIETSYSVFYNSIINEASIYTILMFVCGALLLIYIIYLLIRLGRASTSLRNANVMLEARVEDRTRALRDALNATEAANNAKSTFVTNMNHELRTPLNHIIGYSEMLNEDSADLDRDEVELFASRIATSGRHLLQLVNKVMDLSQIEAGHIELDISRFAATALVDDVSVLAEGLAEKQGNKFEVQRPEDLGEMTSDETRVRQILVNLLGNAAKFTEQGEIILSVARTPGSGQEADLLTFEVKDTGMGMSPDDVARVSNRSCGPTTSPWRTWKEPGSAFPSPSGFASFWADTSGRRASWARDRPSSSHYQARCQPRLKRRRIAPRFRQPLDRDICPPSESLLPSPQPSPEDGRGG